TDTLKKYPEHSRSFELMKSGKEAGVFYPQLHGREHTYVKRWLNYLKQGNKEVRAAFDLGMADVLNEELIKSSLLNYREAFDCENYAELPEIRKTLYEAQNLFTDLFGYVSESFIAP